LENLDDDDDDDDDVDTIRAWKSIRRNMKYSAAHSPGYYKFKQYKTWYHEEHSKFLDKRKQLNCNY
jgi:hypothetical protein